MNPFARQWRAVLSCCLSLQMLASLISAAPPKNSPKPPPPPAGPQAAPPAGPQAAPPNNPPKKLPPAAPRRNPAEALPGLTQEQIAAFLEGKEVFNEVEEPGDGLGPVFNGRSCGECHANGGGSTRISNIVGAAGPMQLAVGGPVIQVKALPGFTPEIVPNNVPVGFRRAMTTQGLGLMGAVPDQTILAEQNRQRMQTPQTAGVANLVMDAVTGQRRVGRVGQKSQHPNSTSFAAEAYLREMGITTPFFPQEEAAFNNPANLAGNPLPGLNDDGADVLKFGTFMDLLAPPPRRPPPTDPTAQQKLQLGGQAFQSIGCADCHTPAWMTGDHPVAALNRQQFQVWSDFLLHDMGPSGDQIPQGTSANGQPIPGSWMRTTPLWGVRLNPALWHDGSIKQGNYAGAINQHDGQGRFAKQRFQMLTQQQKEALLAFIDSL